MILVYGKDRLTLKKAKIKGDSLYLFTDSATNLYFCFNLNSEHFLLLLRGVELGTNEITLTSSQDEVLRLMEQ